MIAIKPLLGYLARPNVSEIALRSNCRPSAKVDGDFQEIDAHVLSSDDLLQVFFAAGGSRYVETLGEKPVQWRTRIEGTGTVVITASARGEDFEAHIALRDPQPEAPAYKAAGSSSPQNVKIARGNSEGALERDPGALHLHSAASHADLAQKPTARSSQADAREVRTKPTRRGPDGEVDLGLEFEAELGKAAQRAAPSSDGSLLTESHRATPREVSAHRSEGPLTRPTTVGLSPAVPVVATLPAEAFALVEDVERSSPPREAKPTFDGIPPTHRNPTLPPSTREAPVGRRRTTRPFARDPGLVELRRLLAKARALSASDLHLIAARPAQVRVARKLQGLGEPLSARLLEDMILPRVPAHIADLFAREGSCDFAFEDERLGRFRVNVSRQRSGLKASFRLVATELPSVSSLGLPQPIELAAQQTSGLIVVAGPPGSGKTTTVAALVDLLNTNTTRHIITVEDPVEYVHPKKRALICQREVGTHTRSVVAALRAALREDPDVIVVAELRDADTVRMALRATEAGYLVIGGMNTQGTVRTIVRLIDLFPPSEQAEIRAALANSLRLIVSQLLLTHTDGAQVVLAAEILPGVLPLANLIREGRTYQIPTLLAERGKVSGFVRLDECLAELVRAGSISAHAALAVAQSPDELEASVNRRPLAASIPKVGAVTVPIPSAELRGGEVGKGLLGRASAIFGKKGT